MKKIWILLLFFPLLCQCKNNHTNRSLENSPTVSESSEDEYGEDEPDGIITIPLYASTSKVNNNLSEVASGIDFVLLDFDPPLPDDFHIDNIELSENHIFVATMTDIKSYDRQGRYIRNIGSRGQGPEEYINLIAPLQLDRAKELVYASDINRHRVTVFRYDGAFEKAYPIMDPAPTIIDSSMIALRQTSYDRRLKPAPLIQFITHDGKGIKTLWSNYYPISQKTEVVAFETSPLWGYKDRFYYLEYGTDTIFRILGDSLVPARILTGDLKLTFMEHYLSLKTGRKLRIAIPITRYNAGIFESNRMIIFRLFSEYERFFTVYNKVTQSIYRTRYSNPPLSLRGDTQWHDYFVDDMISGLNFNPQYQSMGKAMALIPAFEIYNKKKEILNFIEQHPSDKSAHLKKIVEEITEDHNSLMMIVTFK